MPAKMPMEKYMTPVGRASFLYCFSPLLPKMDAEGKADGKPKYTVSLLIPKERSAELDPLRKLVIKVATEAFGKDRDGKKVDVAALLKNPKFNSPLHDGDVEKSEMADYAGHYYIKANSAKKPSVVDAQKKVIPPPADVDGKPGQSDVCYSGCYIRCSVVVAAYDRFGNRGVTCYLNSIQLVRSGPRFGGGGDGSNDFEPIPDDQQADPMPDDQQADPMPADDGDLSS